MAEFFTLDEVAAKLRVSRRTVDRLVHGGRIRVVRLTPGRPAVEARELEAYIAAQRRAA